VGLERHKLARMFATPASEEVPIADIAEELRLRPYVENLTYDEHKYGSEHQAQFYRLYLPDADHRWLGDSTGRLPVLFLVHGGFWKSKWSCENTQSISLVPDFLKRSFAVVLVEYRRREMPGGKWPGPENDVSAALQHLSTIADIAMLDLARVVVLGHSAGGQLALAACNNKIALTGAVKPCLCVSIASVPDMLPGFEARLSDEGDAIEQYMGFNPDTQQQKQSYSDASISPKLPLSCPTLLVSGSEDVDVPPRFLKELYEKCCANPGAHVELLEVYGADHYNLVTADDKMWLEVARAMTRMLQDTCKWTLPPHAIDYGVTETNGFLPMPDPLISCCSEFPDDAKPEDKALLSSWETCTASLPSHLCAGNVREHILSSLQVPHVGGEGSLETWQLLLASDEARAERAFLLLSWLGHAWVWGEKEVSSELPRCVAVPWVEVARILGRPPILTYYSFNASNWRRLNQQKPIELGNLCRLNNFLGGQDEEWFSVVHVAIEAAAGKALTAAVRAQQRVSQGRADLLETELTCMADAIDNMVEILKRMKENCDPYIYYMRVRVFMKGWNADELPDGMLYAGVKAQDGDGWKKEYYFGETGAQSSVVPAIDAALGLAMSEDALSPYLQSMRDYMPPKHADFLRRLQLGADIRTVVLSAAEEERAARRPADSESSSQKNLVEAYNRCIKGLTLFRSIHFELAFSFVRKWDERKDEEIKGTGGTPFMPYLKKHRAATRNMIVDI